MNETIKVNGRSINDAKHNLARNLSSMNNGEFQNIGTGKLIRETPVGYLNVYEFELIKKKD